MSDESTTSPAPRELFTAKTFGTLGGCVMAAGVVTTVICAVFGTDPKKLGLIVSVIVAFVPVLLNSRRRATDMVVAPFNGCLIFFTLVGASSFYPYVNKDTAAAATGGGETNKTASVFAPWVPDANLVSASRDLTEIARQQSETLQQVSNTISTIEEKTSRLQLSPAVRSELIKGISSDKALIQTTATNVQSRVTSLNRLGIRTLNKDALRVTTEKK